MDPEVKNPCPSSTSILDGLNGSTPHISNKVSLAVFVKVSLKKHSIIKQQRNWNNLNLYSTENTTYNIDYLAKTFDGSQMPMLNIFQKDGNKTTHFWCSEML